MFILKPFFKTYLQCRILWQDVYPSLQPVSLLTVRLPHSAVELLRGFSRHCCYYRINTSGTRRRGAGGGGWRGASWLRCLL